MKQLIIFLLLSLAGSCTKIERHSELKKQELTIENKFINVHDTLQYEIQNMSKDHYFYLVLRMDKLSYKPAFENKDFKNPAFNEIISHIYRGGDSLNVNEILVSTSPFFTEDEDEKEYNLYIDSLKQEIFRTTTSQKILRPNESLKIKTLFRNYEKDEITEDEYRMLLENAKSYTLQLSYTSDSTFVKSQISKELLDSLRKNNIKIFHGTIYSNKIPLKFE